jgi:hypothetical protein
MMSAPKIVRRRPEPWRVIVCACGWSGVYAMLQEANAAHADHVTAAPAGDHRYAIGDIPKEG